MTAMGFYSVTRAKGGDYIAWGGLQMLTASGPLSEQQDPIHFCHGETEDHAVDELCSEMEEAHGIVRWWQCRKNCANPTDNAPDTGRGE